MQVWKVAAGSSARLSRQSPMMILCFILKPGRQLNKRWLFANQMVGVDTALAEKKRRVFKSGPGGRV